MKTNTALFYILAILTAGSSCNAQVTSPPISYATRATFDAAAGATFVETFNGAPVGQLAAGTVNTVVAFRDFTITVIPESDNVRVFTVPDGFPAEFGNTGTANPAFSGEYIGWEGSDVGATFIFTFNAPISGFGFDFYDGDSTDSYDLVVDGFDTTNFTNGASFFGISSGSETFTQVTFRQTAAGGVVDGFGFDNFTYTSANFGSVPPGGSPQVNPPVANAGADRTIQGPDNSTSGQGALDGSGSTDPGGAISSYAWTWPGGSASGPTPMITLPLGTTQVTLTVTDDAGNTDQDTVDITVFVNITFTSTIIESRIRVALNKPAGTLTSLDLETLTNLDLSGLGITDLTGLQFSTNLRILDLRNNPFPDPAALWAILDQLGIWCVYTNIRRPGSDPAGLITREVIDTSGNTIFVTIDAPNLPVWDIGTLDIDSTNPANLAALQEFADAGVTIDTGDQNLAPAAAASFNVLNALAGEVQLDASGSSDFDGSIVSYAWSWSGGNASGVNTTVTLPLGETVITLTVTDNSGASTDLVVTVTLQTPLEIAQQAYLKASNSEAGDEFGRRVAVSGDTVVVGTIYEASNATGIDGNQADNSMINPGAAYVFVRNGTTWTQQAYLKASNTNDYDHFGTSVAIHGDTIVVGAWGEGSSATGVDGDQTDNNAFNSGAAYVFVRNGTTWTQQAYLKASNTESEDEFGSSVAVHGDTIVVGANGEDGNASGIDGDQNDNSLSNAGAAYVFLRNGTAWMQQAYLKAGNTGAGDRFGSSVAVAGDTVVVGAYGEESNSSGVNGDGSDNSASRSGAAYVFGREGGNWSQQAYLKASNTGADDLFGWSVAVSGDTVVIGAQWESSSGSGVNGDGSNDSASRSGAAYVFGREGGNWSQQAYLKASNTGAYHRFGWSVAVSGDMVFVGAVSEDSSATGVNGDGSDDSAPDSGAAYVFRRAGGTWSQQAYLKASNTGADDNFGMSVAVSGDTAVVGADGEFSSATGVNGDGSDDSAFFSGAAYVFTIAGSESVPVTIPDAALEAGLRAALNKPTGNLTEADLASLTNLDLSGLGINDLAGLEFATNLRILDLRNNPFPDPAALWAILDQLGIWCVYTNIRRPGSDPADLITREVIDTSGNTIFVTIDAPNLPVWDIGTLDIDSTNPANLTALQEFADAGVTINTGDQNLAPAAAASFTVINAQTGAVELDASVSSDFDGSIVNYAWSWTGGSASGVNPTVTLPSGATVITLTVTDDSGASTGFVVTVTLQTPLEIAQQAYLKADNVGAFDQFGWSVAVSGDTVVVGAWREASNATGVNGDGVNNLNFDSGAAYVFVRDPATGVLTQQAYLKASNFGGFHFGFSVAVSGDTVVVGMPREGSSGSESGAAYVFVREGSTWSQQAYLKASNTGMGDFFGWSVAVSGDTVVVGAPNESSSATGVNGDGSDDSAYLSGAAYVFTREGGTWSQQAYLKASNTGAQDEFGKSVAVSGDTVAIGALFEDSSATGVDGDGSDDSAFGSGVAYVFVREGGTWSQQAYLKASNTGVNDNFGRSVAVSGDTVVVGALFEDSGATGVNGDGSDNSASGSGAAYLFVREGGTWSQQAYIKAGNTGASDQFGFSVAISGDTVVVGAFSEDSNATGVNGDGSDDSAANSGAAYVFVRAGGTWSQQAYLKASNTGMVDEFGHSVAVSGDTVVVGARREASSATGVNGNESDNSASDSGAAYVFTAMVPESGTVTIPDAALEAGLRAALNKPTGNLTEADLASLTNLDLSGLGINDLAGLEFATNLRILDLRNNPFPDPAALWAILDQLGIWCVYTNIRRPSSDPAGLITREVIDISGNTIFVTIDAPNLPVWDIGTLDIDSTNPANLAALQEFADAGVTIDTGDQNLAPAAAASFTIINAQTGEVQLDASGSSDFDGSIVSYAWSWSGGNASGVNPTVSLPTTGIMLTLTITDNDGATSGISFQVNLPTLFALVANAGLTGDDALPDATPFGDGVPNLLKYAFNMNLAGPDSGTLTPDSGTSGLPTYALDDSGPETVVRVQYIRRTGSGLVYTPLKSGDLLTETFEPMNGTETSETLGGGFERVTVTAPCYPVTEPTCFWRVRVTLP